MVGFDVDVSMVGFDVGNVVGTCSRCRPETGFAIGSSISVKEKAASAIDDKTSSWYRGVLLPTTMKRPPVNPNTMSGDQRHLR